MVWFVTDFHCNYVFWRRELRENVHSGWKCVTVTTVDFNGTQETSDFTFEDENLMQIRNGHLQSI